MQAQNFITSGGIDYARELLEKSLGSQKAIDIINRLTSSLQVRPFDFIRRTDPAHLLNFIQQEHPQTVALILAYLEPNKASYILQNIPEELQSDVARRIATMDRTSPDVIKEVESVLERKLASLVNQDYTQIGGVDQVVIQRFVDILHPLRRQQHFGGPRNILMTQAMFEAETMAFDEVVAINIQPGDMQEFA